MSLPYKDERWFHLLQREVAASSVTAVAARLGYKRSRLSQVMNGLMLNAKPDAIAAQVMKLFDKWRCPYLNAEITGEDCRDTYTEATPSHDPAKLAHRRVCRTCNQKKKEDKKS